MPTNGKQIWETGSEPEFFVNRVARWEDAGNGMVRVYFTSLRSKSERVEYTKIISARDLAEMGRDFLRIAAEFHNLLTAQAEEVSVQH